MTDDDIKRANERFEKAAGTKLPPSREKRNRSENESATTQESSNAQGGNPDNNGDKVTKTQSQTYIREDVKKKKPEDIRAELDAAFNLSIRTADKLHTIAIPARVPIMDQWFFEGDLGFIFAPRGLGKTWIALAMSSAIANGGQCGPWIAHGEHNVFYVDGEMPFGDFSRRSEGLECNQNLSVLHHEALFHLAGKVLNLADSIAQEVLTALLLKTKIKVLVLDNLSCLFMGVKENEADAWETVLHWLLTLRRHRIAVIVIHHSGRNKETMRGTSRREDAAFWVLRLDEIEEADPRDGASFLSRFVKDRNSQTEQAPLRWTIQTMSDGRVAASFKEARNIDVFRRWIEDGLECAEDIAKEMGVSKGTVSKLAKKAIDERWLKKEGRKYVLV